MIPVQKKGQKTIMTIEKLDANQDLQVTFFTKQNMKRVKWWD